MFANNRPYDTGSTLPSAHGDFHRYCWELMEQNEPEVQLNLSELDTVTEIHAAVINAMSLRLRKYKRSLCVYGKHQVIDQLKQACQFGGILWNTVRGGSCGNGTLPDQ